ncbi:ABC transporter ATP-binding protein [Marinihelvus fidelis]|uniref:ABC transporter ATP-binding protein n=1 Tax=Marinihelvus fidelis TaxID=2613842 RepID=A0A5N0T449_9GAMM|nr:ABC transporter ATP-binding protein [Marinihelvus fidelis]KAA9129578.1 ABC transporter ATP-binding protein [Marinihelvus fidelis]
MTTTTPSSKADHGLRCHALDVEIGARPVARELDLVLRPGEFWGLLGANGSGKTTLLRHFAGLLPPAGGTLSLDGRPLARWPRRELARSLGMMQQHADYVFDASVLDVALTGRHPYLGPWQRESRDDRDHAMRALATVDLASLADRPVTRLSGGEARRLAFAALLVQSPDTLLLDEPTNHLDFRHQVSVMRTVGNHVYGDGRLAVAALHDVNLAATYCSHVLLLYGEGEWQAGPAPDLLNMDNLERLYQCPVTVVDTPDGRRFHPSFSRLSDGPSAD